MITPKAINLNIDFERSAPLYCEFLRGDSIQFNLTFNDTYNASKLRVFCYTRNGQYAFGNEFSDLTKATFYTNYTAGYSGQATITIQLLDDEENLINSANVICKIIESNSQTPFISSPDFAEKSRTEISEIVNTGKAEIQESISNAKEEIDNWSDQSSRLAQNESDIATLFISKTNNSVLHIGGSGSSIVCANKDGMTAEFTWCRTIKMNWADWEAVSANAYIDGTNLGFGASSTLGATFTKRSTGALGFIYRNASGTAVNYNLTLGETQTLFNGQTHTLCLCVSNGVFQFYIDNKKTSTSSTGSTSSIAQTYNAPTIRNIKAELSRVYNFNFDMSEESAPYTIADYQIGKSIPPSLKRGAGERFNIANATQGTDYQTEFIDCTGQYSFTNGVHRFEITEQTGNYPSGNFEVKFNKTIKAGSDVVINLKKASDKRAYQINFTPKYFTIQGNTAAQGTNSLTVSASNNWEGNTLINNRVKLTMDCNGCYIFISMSAGYFEFTDFSVEVNGATLALEDYTITNGTTKMIFDVSGNNNDATITGSVAGDSDVSVQRLIDFIKA